MQRLGPIRPYPNYSTSIESVAVTLPGIKSTASFDTKVSLIRP